jgi:hypothetical protein
VPSYFDQNINFSIRWKRTHRESRVETSLSDLKSELTQFEQTDPNGEERLYVYANLEKKFDGDWDPGRVMK